MPKRLSYLEAYNNIIPKTQQDKLLEILRSKFDDAGESPDEAILQSELKKLIAELEKPLGDTQVQYRKAGKYGKITSKDYNQTMEEAFVDLSSLYKQDNVVEDVIQKHELLNKAAIRDIRAAMRKVSNDVKVSTIIKENKSGITDAKYDDFYKDNNRSTDKIFTAWVDTGTNTCKLPRGLDQSVLSLRGLATADISVKHYGGGVRGTISREDHRKEKAIDGSLSTFWGEVYLTDEPIKQNYDGSEVYGSVCEITIQLFRKELINYIRYDPFANYPMKILKVKYRLDSADAWTDLGVEQQSSTSTIEYNFIEFEAKEIMIVVNQENPSINTYRIPRSVINNAEMWQQIADRELSVSTETEEPIQATQDMINYVTGWQAYSDAIDRYGSEIKKTTKDIGKDTLAEDIFNVTTDQITKTEEGGADSLKLNVYGKKAPKTDELVEVRKYEYLYGAYEIDIRRLWYIDKGLYISPQYKTNGSVLEAEIDTSEVLPSGTSIEYSLSIDGKNWRNILPSGVYINKERMDVDPITLQGKLRFDTTDANLDSAYRNQTLMPSGVPDLAYSFNESTNITTVASGWYIGTAAYTVSYTPSGISNVTPSGIVADFSQDALTDVEDIFDTGASRNFKVELNHNPYIDFRVLNDTSDAQTTGPGFLYINGKWLNSSGATKYGISNGAYYDPFTVTVDGYPAENRTDYYEDIRPALTQYNKVQYPYYEYFQSSRSLYFNTKIEGKEIKVRYKYLNDFIQFRALLRSNNPANVTLTPLLENYTLKLRTL